MTNIDEFLKEPHFEIKFFEDDGTEVENATSTTYAKSVTNMDTGIAQYYVKTHKGILVHPRNNPILSMRDIDVKWIRVQPSVFTSYMLFLDSKSETHYRQAERGMR